MKLSRIVMSVLSLALVAFMVTDTLAQEDGRRGGRGGGPGGFQRGGGPGGPGGRGGPGGGGDMTFGLLRIEAVQTELEISPDQQEALDKLAEQNRPERPDADFRNMDEEQRRAFFEKMQKEQAERTAQMKDQLIEVLLPEQIERLEQISIQLRGVQALEDDEVAAKLKITDEQKEKLAKVRDELQQKMRDQMREIFSSGDREKIQEAFGKAREDMEEEVLGVLTSTQRSDFDAMKGEPFEMPEGFGRGGPGGRGGFGGGGGGFGRGRGGDGERGEDGGRGGRRRPEAEE